MEKIIAIKNINITIYSREHFILLLCTHLGIKKDTNLYIRKLGAQIIIKINRLKIDHIPVKTRLKKKKTRLKKKKIEDQ